MMRDLLPASLLLLVPYIGHAQDTLPNVMASGTSISLLRL